MLHHGRGEHDVIGHTEAVAARNERMKKMQMNHYPMHYDEMGTEAAAVEIAQMARQIRPRPIPQNIGTFAACRFCGQLVNVLAADVQRLESAEHAIEYATRRCDCTPARRYADDLMRSKRREQAREFALMEAESAIDEQFGTSRDATNPVAESVRKMLISAAEMVYDHKVKNLTLSISSQVKAVIARNAKGKLLIERRESDASRVEVG